MGVNRCSFDRSRGGLVVSVAALMLAVPPTSFASPGGAGPLWVVVIEPSSGSDAVELEVSIGSGIADAEDLQRWVEDESGKATAASASDVARRGVVRIAVEGVLYEYQVTLTAVRDGEPLGAPQAWTCECSNEELLGELRERLPGILEQLKVEPEPEPVVEAPKPAVEFVEPPAPVERISTGEVVGLSLLAVGLAGVATGTVFAVKEPTHFVEPDDFQLESTREYRDAGLSVLVPGAAVASAGLVVYLLRRKSRLGRSRVEAYPTASGTHHGMGLQVVGRF